MIKIEQLRPSQMTHSFIEINNLLAVCVMFSLILLAPSSCYRFGLSICLPSND